MIAVALLIALQQDEIVCEGAYRGHLQGVARDGDGDLYWSFTTTLVKTDSAGKLLEKVEVETHHGDVCVVGDRLYCAVNKGLFNNPAGKADNWIVVYDTSDLSEIGRKPAQIVTHGAGGISSDGDKLVVVGGLPPGVAQNYLYEFDFYLQFHRKLVIESGWTFLGIQTATFAEGRWWLGCYGNPPQLISLDSEFGDLVRSDFDCSLGLVPLGDGEFLVGRDENIQGRGHVGSLLPARTAETGRLSLVSDQ